jgi:O-antigen/teichoic acid export membrane protein
LTAAGVSLPLLIAYGWGWQAPAAGLIASCALWSALALARLRHRNDIAWSARAADVREILVVSLPQIPHLLGFIVLTNSDRLLLAYYLGSSAAGVYAIAFTLATPVLLLSEGVFKAWTPWLFRTLEAGKAEPTAVTAAARGALLAVGALAALTLAYVVLMRIAFPFLVDQRYADAADFFPVLAVAFWMRTIYQVAFSLLLYAGNTTPLAKANVIAAAVNVGANLVLIPVLGLWSAPIALLSGFATLAAVSFTYQMRYFPVPWHAALRPL